jgi:hypothetical protein
MWLSASSRVPKAIMRDLIDTRDGTTYFAGRVWGIEIRYDRGGRHPLVGRSVPDFELGDGDRLNRDLRNGRGLLLDTSSDASLRALAIRWRGRIDYVAHDVTEWLGVKAFLVRPDGATAGATDETADLKEIAAIAARRFGAPIHINDDSRVSKRRPERMKSFRPNLRASC